MNYHEREYVPDIHDEFELLGKLPSNTLARAHGKMLFYISLLMKSAQHQMAVATSKGSDLPVGITVLGESLGSEYDFTTKVVEGVEYDAKKQKFLKRRSESRTFRERLKEGDINHILGFVAIAPFDFVKTDVNADSYVSVSEIGFSDKIRTVNKYLHPELGGKLPVIITNPNSVCVGLTNIGEMSFPRPKIEIAPFDFASGSDGPGRAMCGRYALGVVRNDEPYSEAFTKAFYATIQQPGN